VRLSILVHLLPTDQPAAILRLLSLLPLLHEKQPLPAAPLRTDDMIEALRAALDRLPETTSAEKRQAATSRQTVSEPITIRQAG
jgi:hypothetical protein